MATTKEKGLTFIEKVISVQRDLKAPKSQYNKFGKYYYRNAEDILNSAKPLLVDKGLVLTITDEIVLIGARYYVKATATITDGEQSISTNALAREDETQKGMADSQVTGSTSSYARKYALNGIFCIDDTKDADALNTHGNEQQAKKSINIENRINIALQEITSAKSRQSLTSVWNSYQDLQGNAKFAEAVAEAAKKFPKQ